VSDALLPPKGSRELVPPINAPEGHDWLEYDETHRACRRCGLRLFWTPGAYGQRGWLLVDYNGVTQGLMLASRGGGFGECSPPMRPERPMPAETVIIEYTGDPDRHPSCERYMHKLPRHGPEALMDLRTLLPVCRWQAVWWEIGPARDHVGWTWCGDCFPGKGPPRGPPLPPAEVTIDPAPRRALEPKPRAKLPPKR
jgi:hypothetical protein